MKKYLVGTTAIMMAIMLNSFTLKHSDFRSSDRNLANKFWYRVGLDGKVTQKLGPVARGSVINATCPDSGSIICAKGYDSDPNLQVGDPAPNTNTDDVKKSS